ncbi:MAG: bifunctional class I SAM-dependent methyltransferase/glycosyltransferase family 2 protein [Candidatus Binatia bacterium]
MIDTPPTEAHDPVPRVAFRATPHLELMHGKKSRVQLFYDRLGDDWERWVERSRYYYDEQQRLLRQFVPPGLRVLDVGCGNADHLADVRPSLGVGVDISEGMLRLAQCKHPSVTLRHQPAEELSLPEFEVRKGEGGFDVITMVNVVGELADVLLVFKRLRPLVRPDTRLVIVFYNHLWEPLVKPAAALGLKLDNPTQNWLAFEDFHTFLHLAGFEVVKTGARMPCPKYIPGVAEVMNKVVGRLPVLQRLGFIHYVVARPAIPLPKPPAAYTASVIVPCKNEEGNVPDIVPRVPELGAGTELVFVDDRSTDATAARVREAMRQYPDRRIRLVSGPGRGKGAAVRAGMAEATGDVLMILDADMTVMPEDLPAFFEAITENRGEFINGSRMVYPLADDAMRSANIVGNKLFALLFSFLLEQRIKDTLCGTKVVMRSGYEKIAAARDYFGNIDRWGDYDWIFGAAKSNLKIVDLPIHYVERTAGVTKMTKRFRNGLVMLRMCWVAFRKLKMA